MALEIRVGDETDEIGAPSFWNAWFSTISARLEPNGWGTRYPIVMNNLYQGKLGNANAEQALNELAEIAEKFKEFKPDQVVWDINDQSQRPPWGDDISSDITDLSNYFVTSLGKDLFGVLVHFIERLKKNPNLELIIE